MQNSAQRWQKFAFHFLRILRWNTLCPTDRGGGEDEWG
ncbi:hypothetical protein [Citrobacter pasteurii]|nr:hypothetical protein SF123566_9858 [Shigella flexneri 1235-66]CEJ67233.1 hypothetical protein [Citrobacter pasteurii]